MKGKHNINKQTIWGIVEQIDPKPVVLEADIEIKKEETSEEDPLSNVYHTTQNTIQITDLSGTIIKNEMMYDDQIVVKEELEDDNFHL